MWWAVRAWPGRDYFILFYFILHVHGTDELQFPFSWHYFRTSFAQSIKLSLVRIINGPIFVRRTIIIHISRSPVRFFFVWKSDIFNHCKSRPLSAVIRRRHCVGFRRIAPKIAQQFRRNYVNKTAINPELR